MRGYRQRCRERLERLRRRAEWLAQRIAAHSRSKGDYSYDASERSALLWAIEQIEQWDVVTDVLMSGESNAEKIARLESILRSRLQPSDADLARTPALARQWTQWRGEVGRDED